MKKFTVKTYSAVALDPIHIGTGGQRLGRVDATVVREPVTNVPKIPGTSMSGAIKFFTDLSLRDKKEKINICASTSGSDVINNKHDNSKCAVCVAFGHTTDGKDAQQGILQFTDAMLLAYPVNTLLGPVWITTKSRLKDQLDIGDGNDDCDENFIKLNGSQINNPLGNRLNFGWAMLEQNRESTISVTDLIDKGIEIRYAGRFIIVSDWVFAHLVNDNMEVRTSVVIDPETGAAETGGLFTFEAVARGAIFTFSITENQFNDNWSNLQNHKYATATEMIEENAFNGIAAVGLGGMTTRGFGRLLITELGV